MKIWFVIGLVSFVVLFLIVFMVLSLWITMHSHEKDDETFNKNKQAGKAIIVGYAPDSSDSDVKFIVKIINCDDTTFYELKGIYNVTNLDGSLDSRYPFFNIGDKIQVQYASKKLAGIEVLDVRVDQDVYIHPQEDWERC